jgi:hypothetical protein
LAPIEILLKIAEITLLADREIIDFPKLGNGANAPHTDFEMIHRGILVVPLVEFIFVSREFMRAGFDAFFRINTFAFTSVGAFGQFDRYLNNLSIACYRQKVRKLRFFFFAKTKDPVPMISTYLNNLPKFEWITHVHFDFAALEHNAWMMSTEEKKQEWLTMLSYFSERATKSSNTLIHVTGFPDSEMKDAFLTTLVTIMKSKEENIVNDSGFLHHERVDWTSKWHIRRILDIE